MFIIPRYDIIRVMLAVIWEVYRGLVIYVSAQTSIMCVFTTIFIINFFMTLHSIDFNLAWRNVYFAVFKVVSVKIFVYMVEFPRLVDKTIGFDG